MKKYYKNLNLIRFISCIAVFLYHLNILKGGFLAVCIFFVLTGYLDVFSAFNKDNFSIKEYYKNKIKRLYIPLIIVIFITVAVISFFPNILWLNLKREVTSSILSYNNFWQLSINSDYFARHINSPFMHLWYISILVQLDILFPFIFLLIKKISNKFGKKISCTFLFIISIISSIYFYKTSLNNDIMSSYYSTFSRIFSYIYGITLGFIHNYYGNIVFKKNTQNKYKNLFLYSYLIICIFLFIKVDALNNNYALFMIIVSFISCRLIEYSTISISYENTTTELLIKEISNISYEIYLIQYPVIFLFQYINAPIYLKNILIILLVIILSYILNYILKNNKKNIIKNLITTIIIIFTIFGLYKYITSKDYTEEMKLLEKDLEKNAEIIKKRQEEYALKEKEEEENFNAIIKDFDNAEEKLKEMVTNISIVGVGDSVMLGAVNNLYDKFPNGYFDASISRTAWVLNGILEDLKDKNIVGKVMLFNLGANGDCPEEIKIQIMENCKDSKVFWVNVTNDSDVHVNDKLNKFKEKYDNLYIIDWNNISKGHPEYFLPDKIHLTEIGRSAYADAIYQSIFEVYLGEYNKEKDKIIEEYENNKKKKITFYGNDILLNSYDYLKDEFKDDNFIIKNNYTFKMLKEEIQNDIKTNKINHNIVLAFDSSLNISKEEYIEIIEMCNNYNIYILNVNNINNIEYDNVTILDFNKEIINNNNYLMVDKIHLTQEGNINLSKFIINNIK